MNRKVRAVSTEQRVVPSGAKVGQQRGAPPPAASPAAASDPAPRRGRGRLIGLALAAILLAGAGAGYWFLVGPGAAADSAAVVVEQEPGEVMPVESVSINLANGRYLRVGLGLQLSAEVEEELDPSKALDRTISLFSGRTIDEVTSAEGRVLLKAELTRQLQEVYHGEVLEVFFTEYVTQ